MKPTDKELQKMAGKEEQFNFNKFIDFSYLLRKFVCDLDIYLFNCKVSHKTKIEFPTHAVKKFICLLYEGYENDAEEYVLRWESQIVISDSSTSAIAEYELPAFNSLDHKIGSEIEIHPTAHGYAAILFLFITEFLTKNIWGDNLNKMVPEVVERLKMIRYEDSKTLARVSARMMREQAILASYNGCGLSTDELHKSIQSRLSAEEKSILLLACLTNHHQSDGEWNDTPISAKEIINQGVFNNEPAVSRAFGALFGKGKMKPYWQMISDKRLSNFLRQKNGDTIQGFLSFNESITENKSSPEDTFDFGNE